MTQKEKNEFESYEKFLTKIETDMRVDLLFDTLFVKGLKYLNSITVENSDNDNTCIIEINYINNLKKTYSIAFDEIVELIKILSNNNLIEIFRDKTKLNVFKNSIEQYKKINKSNVNGTIFENNEFQNFYEALTRVQTKEETILLISKNLDLQFTIECNESKEKGYDYTTKFYELSMLCLNQKKEQVLFYKFILSKKELISLIDVMFIKNYISNFKNNTKESLSNLYDISMEEETYNKMLEDKINKSIEKYFVQNENKLVSMYDDKFKHELKMLGTHNANLLKNNEMLSNTNKTLESESKLVSKMYDSLKSFLEKLSLLIN